MSDFDIYIKSDSEAIFDEELAHVDFNGEFISFVNCKLICRDNESYIYCIHTGDDGLSMLSVMDGFIASNTNDFMCIYPEYSKNIKPCEWLERGDI